ncbi:hypothetical protein RHSIM_Rhsim07G0171200 [Rhododendron simsii]|uniref:U3 small nucleolar RNA-associated protein 20 N-terminal domain-containing protein n=1 Tax=Rhododendron simsii TaxID=118357 RepID=A0A834GUY6_RHOSS|nr:hypothetical protein RHSIM_Rhsim07G0171200 [Rhododendron simsii]
MHVKVQSPSFLDEASREQVSRICIQLESIGYWIEIIYEILHGDSSTSEEYTVQEETSSVVLHPDLKVEKAVELLGLMERFHLFLCPPSDNNPCAIVLSLLIRSLQKIPAAIESHSRQLVPLFLKVMGYNVDDLVSGLPDPEPNILIGPCLAIKFLLVFFFMLLDENDAEIWMTVLDCLVNLKDDFLVPYDQHVKYLISSRSLREELTTWSLSKESNFIEESHRTDLVPLVIRILIPKVRKLKTLASQKEVASSAKPSSLFSCFLSMSGSYKLVWHREKVKYNKIVNAISPLLTSVRLDVRMFVCDLLDALAETDSSLVTVVK